MFFLENNCNYVYFFCGKQFVIWVMMIYHNLNCSYELLWDKKNPKAKIFRVSFFVNRYYGIITFPSQRFFESSLLPI
jgi:hypothetical protein